jgi:ribosomal protein S18 acetylase RimI-like enzyme
MKALMIRPYRNEDEQEVIALWFACRLVVPANNPKRDIERKLLVNPELFLVGGLDKQIVATCMAGYEGHRGWINYLAVSPDHRRQGFATMMMTEAAQRLKSVGCPKINIQIRATNKTVIAFYESMGFTNDDVLSMGKRLESDPPFVFSKNKFRENHNLL